MKPAGKILVIRNDKIGDFMLAWPAICQLKIQFPDTEISALVPEYTAPLAENCRWIDHVIIDPKSNSLPDLYRLSQNIRKNKFNVSISLFSDTPTSFVLWLAGIKNRLGPATKLAQLFLNNKLKQKRSQSIKSEYEYNIDLAQFYITQTGQEPLPLPGAPYLSFDDDEISRLDTTFRKDNNITQDKKIVFIHPGTGGSAVNLSLEQYANLISSLDKLIDAHFVLTAGPGEEKIAVSLSELIPDIEHHTYHSRDGIINFSKHIKLCDLFISGSTGPLHIAGALNVNTAAFYPAKRSATALRWKTINQEDKRIHFSPQQHTGDDVMKQIDPVNAANLIIKKFYG